MPWVLPHLTRSARIQVWTCTKAGIKASCSQGSHDWRWLGRSLGCVHTHLDSSEPGFPWARPCSWWAGDCAGTEIPILSCMTFRTYIPRRWRSLQETSPVVSCSSSCTRSRRRWQNQPGSEQAGLHPKERLSPACRGKSATWMRAKSHSVHHTLRVSVSQRERAQLKIQSKRFNASELAAFHIRHKREVCLMGKLEWMLFSLRFLATSRCWEFFFWLLLLRRARRLCSNRSKAHNM